MRTRKQNEASRRNGARSRGPVTLEGKTRSARNSTVHGLSSKVVVLANENPEAYEKLLAAYVEHWKPATQPEFDLVHDIVAARWRLNRTLAIESATLDLEMDRQRERVDHEFSRIDEPTRCALACDALMAGPTLGSLNRHEGRLRRAMHRAAAELRTLQAALEQQKTTNEPGDPQVAPDEPLAA